MGEVYPCILVKGETRMGERHARRDAVLTPWQLGMLRGRIKETAARFRHRLSAECVEDLMQEVLLRLWRSGAQDRLRDSPSYVRRVAANATIDTLRRQSATKRRMPTAKQLSWLLPQTPEEILMAREEAYLVLATNRYLRRRVRRAIREHFPQAAPIPIQTLERRG